MVTLEWTTNQHDYMSAKSDNLEFHIYDWNPPLKLRWEADIVWVVGNKRTLLETKSFGVEQNAKDFCDGYATGYSLLKRV